MESGEFRPVIRFLSRYAYIEIQPAPLIYPPLLNMAPACHSSAADSAPFIRAALPRRMPRAMSFFALCLFLGIIRLFAATVFPRAATRIDSIYPNRILIDSAALGESIHRSSARRDPRTLRRPIVPKFRIGSSSGWRNPRVAIDFRTNMCVLGRLYSSLRGSSPNAPDDRIHDVGRFTPPPPGAKCRHGFII